LILQLCTGISLIVFARRFQLFNVAALKRFFANDSYLRWMESLSFRLTIVVIGLVLTAWAAEDLRHLFFTK